MFYKIFSYKLYLFWTKTIFLYFVQQTDFYKESLAKCRNLPLWRLFPF